MRADDTEVAIIIVDKERGGEPNARGNPRPVVILEARSRGREASRVNRGDSAGRVSSARGDEGVDGGLSPPARGIHPRVIRMDDVPVRSRIV